MGDADAVPGGVGGRDLVDFAAVGGKVELGPAIGIPVAQEERGRAAWSLRCVQDADDGLTPRSGRVVVLDLAEPAKGSHGVDLLIAIAVGVADDDKVSGLAAMRDALRLPGTCDQAN